MSPVHTPQISDEALLERAARDPEAFGLFYDRFEAELLRFFVRATRRGEPFATAPGAGKQARDRATSNSCNA